MCGDVITEDANSATSLLLLSARQKIPTRNPKTLNLALFLEKRFNMKNGVCPKCGSKNIYVADRRSPSNFVVVTWARGARLTTYVCTECGFAERYIRDKQSLRLISENCPKVPTHDSGNEAGQR